MAMAVPFRDKSPNETEELANTCREYHILTVGRTHAASALTIFLGKLQPSELFCKCHQLSQKRSHCINCGKKPQTAVALGIRPSVADPKRKFTLICNFPVCEADECADWVYTNYEKVLDKVTEEGKLAQAKPKRASRVSIEAEPNMRLTDHGKRLMARKLNVLQHKHEVDTKSEVCFNYRGKVRNVEVKYSGDRSPSPQSPSRATVRKREKKRLYKKRKRDEEVKRQLEIEAQEKKDAERQLSIVSKLISCLKRNKDRKSFPMPERYRPRRPIPHTARAFALEAFFACPPPNWKGRHVWKDCL